MVDEVAELSDPVHYRGDWLDVYVDQRRFERRIDQHRQLKG